MAGSLGFYGETDARALQLSEAYICYFPFVYSQSEFWALTALIRNSVYNAVALAETESFQLHENAGFGLGGHALDDHDAWKWEECADVESRVD